MSTRLAICAAALATLCGGAFAAPLTLPEGALLSARQSEPLASYALPLSPWKDGAMDTQQVEGAFSQSAYRLPDSQLATLEILAPLRDQLEAEGFEILFTCETDGCGGFDFRYSTRILPEPDMHVDLGDFRFLSARKGAGEAAEYLSLLASRSAASGFLQLTRVLPPGHPEAAALSAAAGATDATGVTGEVAARPVESAPAAAAGSLAEKLERDGHSVLDDLVFESGSAQLGAGPFATLAELAAYLAAHPGRTIALVGHTDAEGSLEANVALSKKRAASVAERLISVHGVDAAQISAEGMGFLSPLASNLTEDGRTKNRRVEVILTSTQ
ncbi:putative lipoprotein YiaD precursor [Pseudoruegeria aquimaris]|uniref:Putative lipoprotein YiaD n=1 Tax=Pseudoruegeria aquimaris TaxID=393663 RepID=A0A1Y5SE61_9RHOB|nr:OmpA family protein [Pseudoruegeria aquimaris]SLN35616.1 putative lipoprotein YiaD precursor [Pseudoruegeria aquimaris]